MTKSRRIHFIAIGGVVMHNLAIDAHLKGYEVSGSDDEIYEPSRSNLENHGLLPQYTGWNPDIINTDIEAVILGMHAKIDNPELLKAQELNIPVYSFPEYIYQQSTHKHRVVIAGSHGKSSITAMVMHVLLHANRKFDYLVGAKVEGFEQNIKLSEDAPVIIIEGDEYFSSPLDNTPKCLHYQHHIGLISGIAWDHMNVYPTFADYLTPFEKFAAQTPKSGVLVYAQDDPQVTKVCKLLSDDVTKIPYKSLSHKIVDGKTYLTYKDQKIPLQVFGKHNIQNISGAKQICLKVGITEDEFYQAIANFKGAGKRLQKVAENNTFNFFIDFAHSPSKLQATSTAVKQQYKSRELIACMELHTFSSLNKSFLPQYKNSFKAADQAIIYFNPEIVERKKLETITEQDIYQAFKHSNLKVFTKIDLLKEHLLKINWHNKTLLMMSSGNYDSLDVHQLGKEILEKL